MIDGEGGNELGITEDDVRTKVELHLRQAGIRPHLVEKGGIETEPSVFAQVLTYKSAFVVQIVFRRAVSWTLPNGRSTGQWWLSPWSKQFIGVQEHDRVGVLSEVGELMDKFLNEYLKANQEGGK